MRRSAGRPAEVLPVVGDRGAELRSRVEDEGQEPVGRAARDDLERSGLLHPAKRFDEAPPPGNVERFRQETVVHVERAVELRVDPSPLAPHGLEELARVAAVAVLEERIREHLAERRAHRHGEPEPHAVGEQPLHHPEDRDVRLRDRLVEPVLFEEFRMLRMADEREVRVQDEAQIARGSRRHPITFFRRSSAMARRRDGAAGDRS